MFIPYLTPHPISVWHALSLSLPLHLSLSIYLSLYFSVPVFLSVCLCLYLSVSFFCIGPCTHTPQSDIHFCLFAISCPDREEKVSFLNVLFGDLYVCAVRPGEFQGKEIQTNSQSLASSHNPGLAATNPERPGLEQPIFSLVVRDGTSCPARLQWTSTCHFCSEMSMGLQRLKLSARELIPYSCRAWPLSAQISCHTLPWGTGAPKLGADGPPVLGSILGSFFSAPGPAQLTSFLGGNLFFYFERSHCGLEHEQSHCGVQIVASQLPS